jgi:hypothetical protein
MNAPTVANAFFARCPATPRTPHGLPPRTRPRMSGRRAGAAGRPGTEHARRGLSEALISRAPRTLGELPLAEFRDPSILKAARHGREALRGQSPWRPR